MSPQSQTPNRHRLLIVDNDRDCADALCELLRLTSDWDVEAAYGPVAALSQARARPPYVVLLDMEMPGMNGFQTADRLLQEQPLWLPHLVAMTGNSNLQVEASGDARFEGSLLKPADNRQVLGLLSRFAALPPPAPWKKN